MNKISTAGYFLIGAGLLLLTRMIPVFANMPEGFEGFPPASVDQMALLAVHNPWGWHLSHYMGLLALPLLWVGMFIHYQHLAKGGVVLRSLLGMVGLTCGVILFAIALIFDGFLVPFVSQVYMADSLPHEVGMFLTDLSHKSAIIFFVPGVLSLFVGAGLFAMPFSHANIHSRWLGFAGLFLANLGVVGHLAGWTGENFNKMPVAGISMMGLFLWLLALGIFAVRRGRVGHGADPDQKQPS